MRSCELRWIKPTRACAVATVALIAWTTWLWPSEAWASTAYICRDADGHRSIQDRPCTANNDSRTVDIEPRWKPAPARRSGPVHSSPPVQRPPAAVARRWSARDASRCRQYQQGKFQVQSRMRAGYTAQEGERLRAGLSKLDRMIEDKCRSVPQRYWIQGNASERPG